MQDQTAQGIAKEEDTVDAASRAFGGRDVSSGVPEPVSYARDRLFICIATPSEDPNDAANAVPSSVVETSTGQKGATRVNFSERYGQFAVGKAPQQKCVAWRSSVVDCNGVGR